MQDLNGKIKGNKLTAAEWNEIPSEIQNVIEASGQTLSSGNLTQLRKAIPITLDNIAELRAVTVGAGIVKLKGYYTDGDGGGGFIYWDPSSTETDNGATIFKATAIAIGRWKRNLPGFLLANQAGAKGDGDGAGGGTDDSTALQAWLDYLLANGGQVSLNPGLTYRCDSALTLTRTSSSDPKRFTVNGNSARLDFSNLTGSAIGFLIGASSASFWTDSGQIVVENLKLLGPETLAPNITTNSPTTTTIGLFFQFALNVSVNNVYISRFHTGIKTESCFPLTSNYVHCASNYVGAHIYASSNAHQWNNLQVTDARFGLVCEASATNGMDMVTFIAPRVETCYIGAVIDAGASSINNIHGINIHNPFMNANTRELLVLNKAYDFSDPTNTATWADRDGKVNNFMWMGGRLSTSYNPVIRGEATYGSIRGAHIQTAVTRARITGLYPNGSLVCQFTSSTTSKLDIYYYNDAGDKYVNIADGAIRTNKSSGNETFIVNNNETTMKATFENKDSAGELRVNIQNDASGALQMFCYGSTHATKANETEINSANADLDIQRGGSSGVKITATTGNTGGSASGGAGNQYVELEIGGVRYKLLHDGGL